MGLRVQSTVGCISELCIFQFSVAQVLLGLRKPFLTNFVFPTWTSAGGFKTNNNSVSYESEVWSNSCIY